MDMDKEEFKKERRLMVATQLVPRGISEPRLLEVMRTIPRHEFVPPIYTQHAYDDCALPVGHGQTISQPYMVAVMTQLLALSGTEKVLEVGTGTGYQSAILSALAAEVYTIETIEALYKEASDRLSAMGYDNVHTQLGDGSKGWPEHAPYDRILVTAGAPTVPSPLVEQLADGGILVIPVGSSDTQELLCMKKSGDEISTTHHTLCAFVPLLGEFAWKRDNGFD